MRKQLRLTVLPLVQMALLAACGTEQPTANRDRSAEPLFHSFTGSAWSEPVNIGPPINVPNVRDGNPVLSSNGLVMYFDSDRADLPGAQGAGDIWVTRRACTDVLDPSCAWQTPVHVGPVLNTEYVDGSAELSDDGHLLFFLSHKTRVDCAFEPGEPDPTRPCDGDLYVSWRPDPSDHRGWRVPVRLGPEINTSGEEGGMDYLPTADPGLANFYFARDGDIHRARIRITRRGNPSGIDVQVLDSAVPVSEINSSGRDGQITLRADGRELFFFSQVRGAALDLFTSTRGNPREPWSAPVNLGARMNTAKSDQSPALSHDGRTLFFTSTRDGLRGPRGWDIYVSTRTPSGR